MSNYPLPIILSLWPTELYTIIGLLDSQIQRMIIDKDDSSEIFFLDSIKDYLEHKREVAENV